MRFPWVLVILALLLTPAAEAASATLEDGEGDAQVHASSGAGQADPSGISAPFDLLRMEAVEVDRDVRFTIETLAASDDRGILIVAEIDVGGEPYVIAIDETPARQTARLENAAVHGSSIPLDLQVDGATRAVTVPKTLLIDADNSAATVGTRLSLVEVRTDSGSLAGSGNDRFAYTQDVMEGPAAFAFELGAAPWMDVRLASPAPFRGSNGASTVFVYDVQVAEMNGHEQTVALGARDVPPNWEVQFPLEVVNLAATETRSVPVLVKVPSMHQHGDVESLFVQATHIGGESILSELELGVRFTSIPQPAGHHPTLWLHSRASSSIQGDGFFNAALEDDRDEAVDVNNDQCVNVGIQNEYLWTIPLDPRLDIGLDFDVSQPVRLTVPFRTEVPVTDVTVSATLAADPLVLARLNETKADDLDPGVTVMELTLDVLPEADLVPFQPNQEMTLRIVMLATDPHTRGCVLTGISIAPGGELDLPLLEYHDPPTQAAAGALTADDAPPLVAPGSRLVVHHALQAPPGTTFSLRLFGHGAEFAELTTETVSITSGTDTATFSLVIQVPENAPEGQNVDLVVEASGGDVFGLARTAFTIASAGDKVEDQAPEAQAEVQAPGLPVPLAALAVLAGLSLASLRARHGKQP